MNLNPINTFCLVVTFTQKSRCTFAAMKNSLRVFVLLSLLLFAQRVFAQPGGGQQGPPQIGTVIGIVSDSATGQKN